MDKGLIRKNDNMLEIYDNNGNKCGVFYIRLPGIVYINSLKYELIEKKCMFNFFELFLRIEIFCLLHNINKIELTDMSFMDINIDINIDTIYSNQLIYLYINPYKPSKYMHDHNFVNIYNNSPYYKELILFFSDIVEEYKNSNLKYSKYDLLKNGKILQKYYIKHKYKLDIMTTIDEEIFVCEKINFDNAYKEFDKYIVSKMDLFLSRDYSSNMNIINDNYYKQCKTLYLQEISMKKRKPKNIKKDFFSIIIIFSLNKQEKYLKIKDYL